MDDTWFLLLSLVGITILLLASLLALVTYSGLFHSVDVKTGKPPIGSCYIAYKDGTGPYRQVGAMFSESTSIGPTLKQLGIYYDHPEKVPSEKLRWVVGAILAENDEQVDEELRQAYEKEKYKFMSLPAVETSVNSVFPYATMISIFIAIKRVYPAFDNYISSYGLRAFPCLEVYFGGNIHFMAPVSDQMSFYSPKALETEETGEEASPEAEVVKEEPLEAFPRGDADTEVKVSEEVSEEASESDDSFEKIDADEMQSN